MLGRDHRVDVLEVLRRQLPGVAAQERDREELQEQRRVIETSAFVAGGELALARMIGTTTLGYSPPEAMIATARSFGLQAQLQIGLSLADLSRFLAAGETVILMWLYEITKVKRSPTPCTGMSGVKRLSSFTTQSR